MKRTVMIGLLMTGMLGSALAQIDATHGKLEIAWENVTASAPFTVK